MLGDGVGLGICMPEMSQKKKKVRKKGRTGANKKQQGTEANSCST